MPDRVSAVAGPGRPGVLLDLDGTLVDTNYLHTLAWSRALADAGEWAPMNAIHRLVGMGGDQLVKNLLGDERPGITEARATHYRALLPEARAFPGASDLVRALHGRGLCTVLATSSPADELDAALGLLSITDVLDGRTTADDVEQAKPSPEVFSTAMRLAGVDPARALAVGDSVWDVEAAQSAGIACIAVESGGFSRHELTEAGALLVFRDVSELLGQLNVTPVSILAGEPATDADQPVATGPVDRGPARVGGHHGDRVHHDVRAVGSEGAGSGRRPG